MWPVLSVVDKSSVPSQQLMWRVSEILTLQNLLKMQTLTRTKTRIAENAVRMKKLMTDGLTMQSVNLKMMMRVKLR